MRAYKKLGGLPAHICRRCSLRQIETLFQVILNMHSPKVMVRSRTTRLLPAIVLDIEPRSGLKAIRTRMRSEVFALEGFVLIPSEPKPS